MQHPRAAGRWPVWCAQAVLGATLVLTATPSLAAAVSAPAPATSVTDQTGLHSPHLATRMDAELRADIKDAVRDVRPYVAPAIEVLVGFLVLRVGVRFLRRRHARQWAGVHLMLDLTPFPATDFTLHTTRRARKRVAANVVRLEIAAGRTTSTAYAEVAG
jgi:hypothetical protein